jgi:two-component system, OmpR family, sensor kinase
VTEPAGRREPLARLDALPIRWRLALTSAAMTLAILLMFALVFGVLTTRQMRSDFDAELRAAAAQAQAALGLGPDVAGSEERLRQAVAGDAVVRVLDARGTVVAQRPADAPDLGPPRDGVRTVEGHRVVARAIVAAPETPFAPPAGRLAGFVQYAEPTDDLDASLSRLRLLLALGVLAGAGLALLAGLAIARRAMAPIAALTGAASGIARTRDPGVRLPAPRTDDEVAALARTLDEMLVALTAARAETETALERQREFVADASHELRTPLTSVLANLELLEAALEGEDAEVAASALRSSRRMRRLVADLLLLARADAGRRSPRRPTDVGAVLAAAAAELAPLADGRELSIEAEPALWVEAAPDDLHRLALNLIENALRHTPPGTPVRALGRRAGEHVELVVEDEGPGVPAELRAHVFDRFVRGGGDAAGGSGLGLAIVRAVAEAHGGAASVGERPGGGARFAVTLPAGAPPPPAGESEAAAGPAPGHQRSL